MKAHEGYFEEVCCFPFWKFLSLRLPGSLDMSFSPAHPCLTQVQFSPGTFEPLAMAGGQALRSP